MVETSRRGVLKGAASIGGGFMAPVGVATPDDEGGDGVEATARDLLTFQEHINVPGYYYLGSIRREDFCYWAESSCIYLGVVSFFAAGPFTATAIGTTCHVSGGGCRLYDDVERLTPYEFKWIHMYLAQDWYLATFDTPKFIALPEPTTNPTDGQKMVAEAVAEWNNDDGKIGTGELSKAINAWSTGSTVPGTDHKVSTDSLLIMIEFWSKGKSVK